MAGSNHLSAGKHHAPQYSGGPPDRASRVAEESAPRHTYPGLRPGLIGDLLDHLGPDSKQNIHTIVHRTPTLLAGRSSIYQRCDPQGNCVATVSACNLPSGFKPEAAGVSPPWADFSPERPRPGPGSGHPGKSPPAATLPPLRDHGLKSNLTMPVFNGWALLGAFSVFDDKERGFTPDEIFLVATLARMLAIEEQRLEREQEHRRQWAAEKQRAEQETAALLRHNRKLTCQSADYNRTILELSRRERELETKIKTLKEQNQALETLRRSHAAELNELEERTLGGLREGVEPLIAGLKDSALTEEQQAWVSRLEQKLIETAAPFAMHQKPQYRKLSPTEIKVAVLIRQNHTNKQIGQTLGISTRTVEVHRNNIRRKLGLRQRGVNLKTHLQYMP